MERKLSEEEFNRLMQFNIIFSVKLVLYIYKIDLYCYGLKMLEACIDDKCNAVYIPNCFTVISEVTIDLKYQNINYGLEIEKKNQKKQ